MFALFNRMSGAGDAISDEALIAQSCAGRTDGIRLSLEFLGYVPKGPTKAQVLRVLDDIIGNPGDIKGADALRVSLPLFAAASALMLRSADRTLADGFRVNFEKGMADLKAARATARALVKAAGKDKASTPTEDKASTPTEDKASKPTEDKASKPTEDKASKPTEDKASKPTEDKASKPTEDKASKPTEDKASKPTEDKASKPTEDKASTPNRIDAAIALLDAAVNANTLTDAQCAALRAMVERMAIPA